MPGPAVPRATIRLQFHKEFGFDRATALVPYFAKLGISHIYASPFLKAREGSTHGYDITDHNQLNPEIGDWAALDRLTAALEAHGMGLILDFVPNHMGVGSGNPWWMDVLEWGEASPYAAFFDIDWHPLVQALDGKVLLPVLGDHYGGILDRGELVLAFEAEAGAFAFRYYDHRFPLAVKAYGPLLRHAGRAAPEAASEFEALAAGFEALTVEKPESGPGSAQQQAMLRREAEALKSRLAELARTQAVADGIQAALAEVNGQGGDGREGEAGLSHAALHRLLEAQNYRVAFWRVASDEINYRRFFDVNDLAGLRVEHPECFEMVHGLVFRLISEGRIQGLRLDHVDGLFDPIGYCHKLQDRIAYLMLQSPASAPLPAEGIRLAQPFYLLIEKILVGDEHLGRDWPVAGTTGYEFMAAVGGLFVDPSNEAGMTEAYARFVGQHPDYDAIMVEAKRRVVMNDLVSELTGRATELYRLAQQSWASRDYTLTGLRRALVDVVSHFPVYRTYVTPERTSDEDRRHIEHAIRRAKRRTELIDTSVFDFLGDALTGDLARLGRPGYDADTVFRVARKVQQFTGPVMAKAVEDTAYYRYNRLVSLNEVGGDPDRFGTPPDLFHRQNRERLERFPHGLVATATHDHKRGEDTRARLNVLSEMPEEWARRTEKWSRLNAPLKRRLGDRPPKVPAPSAEDEYLLYQILVGTWPPDADDPTKPVPGLADRVAAYMQKAVREGKRWSSWSAPDAEYEAALEAFVRALLDPGRSAAFLSDLVDLVALIRRPAAVNGLAQTLLKLTVPGVPDIYQGTEFWDFSLVDPDNRRPVDWAARTAALDQDTPLDELLAHWPDGRVKQRVVAAALGIRRERPALFAAGDYVPLQAEGAQADHVVAFLRRRGADLVLVAVPRLSCTLLGGTEGVVPPRAVWSDTALRLDDVPADLVLHDAFGAGALPVGEGGRIAVADLFARFPVAMLLSR